MGDLAAVLFDLDGTIVDTEPAWFAAEHALVEAHGGTWTDEHAANLVGSALLDGAEYIARHGGVPLPAEQIVDHLVQRVLDDLRTGAVWRPGARELLAALQAEAVPCALVTMSYEPIARHVADLLPPGTFQVVVAGDHVTQGKPHPEPYLLAAERLGVDPRWCVAVEDSPTGAASAEAAGCLVLGVPHAVDIEPGPARWLMPSLTQVSVADLQDAIARHEPQDPATPRRAIG